MPKAAKKGSLSRQDLKVLDHESAVEEGGKDLNKVSKNSSVVKRNVEEEEEQEQESGGVDSVPSTPSAATHPFNRWTGEDRLALLEAVVNTSTTDWIAVASKLGKSRSQVYDQWRKFLWPQMKKSVLSDVMASVPNSPRKKGKND